MNTYPISLDLAGQQVVIVGGGRVASRRVPRLLDAGARVRVVAPDLHDALAELTDPRLEMRRRPYESGDLTGALIAFVATDDASVNERVVADARALGVLVNAAHDGSAGDFRVPAVARLGELQVAIDTAGTSPVLAGALRRTLEDELSVGWSRALVVFGELRRRVGDRIDRDTWWQMAGEIPSALETDEEGVFRWLTSHLSDSIDESTLRDAATAPFR